MSRFKYARTCLLLGALLCGSYAQQWERLGRSVPPVMMNHIAATIRDEILSKL